MWRTWFRLNAIYFSFYVRHLDGLAKLQLVLSHIFSAAFWFVFFWSVECVVHWAERLCTLKVINDDDIYPMIRTFLLRSTPWQVNLSNQILIKKRTNSASDDQWMTPLSNIIFITLLLLFTSKIVLIILCVFFFRCRNEAKRNPFDRKNLFKWIVFCGFSLILISSHATERREKET